MDKQGTGIVNSRTAERVAVDLDQLREVAERTIHEHGFGIIAGAILLHVLDRQATWCRISLWPIDESPLAQIVIEDDGSRYGDLAAARSEWTKALDANSPAEAHGMALLLARATDAGVESERGRIDFDGQTFKQTGQHGKLYPRLRCSIAFRCDAAQFADLEQALYGLCVPKGFVLKVNDRRVLDPAPVRSFEAVLPEIEAGKQ